MKTEKKGINKDIVIMIVLNIIFFLLLFFFGLNDETKDDFLIQSYFMPKDGISVPFHMWTNCFWSFGIYCLQKVFPVFAWQYFLSFLLIYISINTLIWWILEEIGIRWCVGITLSVYVLLLVYCETIYTFNFTRTAGFTSSIGYLYILNNNKNKRIFGSMLFILGILARSNVIYYVVGFFVVYAFSELYHKKYKGDTPLNHQSLLIMILSIVICLFLQNVSRNLYSSHNDWNELRILNNSSSSIMDYQIPNYSDAEGTYKSIGITLADYSMIMTRMSNSDPSYFSVNLNKKIASISKNSIFHNILDFSGIRNQLLFCFNNAYCLFVVSILVLFLITYNNKLNTILIFVAIISYLMLFQAIGRKVDRVLVCIFFYAFSTMLLCLAKEFKTYSVENIKHKRIILMLIIILFISNTHCFMHNNLMTPKHTNEDYTSIYDYTESDKEHFYLYASGCFVEHEAVKNLLLSSNYWDTSNTFYMTQFPISPHEKYKLDFYHIDNIYKDCINSQIIRIIDRGNIGIILDYIHAHYCESASAVLIDTVGCFSIYTIISE